MNHRFALILLVLLGLMPAFSLGAAEFSPIGQKAMSMGGAGVATARSCYAAYYNPALLAAPKTTYDIGTSFGASIRETNLTEHIDNMADLNIDETFRILANGGSPDQIISALQTTGALITELRAISDGNALQITPSVNIGSQFGNFGFGIYSGGEMAATAIIDTQHMDIIVQNNTGTQFLKYDPVTQSASLTTITDYQQNSLEYAINNGLTYLNVTGLVYFEVPISYGHRFETPMGKLDLGGSFKIMPGYTYIHNSRIDTESDDIDDDADNDKERSTQFGVDLGLIFKPKIMEQLSLGITGKNLNTPEFKTPIADDIKVKPQIRMGVAYDLSSIITFAADMDLSKNDTLVEDYKSQYIGGGVDFHPCSFFSLRGGLMKNLAESIEGTILTFGVGIGPQWLHADLCAMASTKSSEFNGNTIPRYAKIQLAVSSAF